MSGEAQALKLGDQLLDELKGVNGVVPAAPSHAPTMGKLKKCSYTHDALIDMIIERPELDQNALAAAWGYTPGWISNILASEAFQAKMAARRELIIDPEIKATIKERFEALTIRSLQVLQEKLSKPNVSDTVALRAAELGARALGVGGHAPPGAPSVDRLERLAGRLVTLNRQAQEKTVNGEVLESTVSQPEAKTG